LGVFLNAGLELGRSTYSNTNNWFYDVTFSPLSGDLPALRVIDTSKLDGSNPSITITTIRNGSTDVLLGPIPAELLQMPVPYNDSIQLEVNGIAAACAEGVACRFSHAANRTPRITGVTQAGDLDPSKGNAWVRCIPILALLQPACAIAACT
jgi:hypothetical protein